MKAGRPRKPTLRDSLISVQVSADEKARIEARAAELGYTTSAYVRFLALREVEHAAAAE